MKSALAGTVERARSTLSTISLGQKVVIGLLLVGLLLGGFFFFRWITAPTQAPLFSNLASADASAIVDELNAAGVAYELTDGGQTIMVAQDAVYDLRLSMSGKGLPAGEDTGYALLEDQGITTSEFQQQATYRVASSIQDTEPDQVTLADSSVQVLSAAGQGMTAAAGDARSQVETEQETRLAAKAQTMLDRVLGPGRSVVSVRAEVDLAERE